MLIFELATRSPRASAFTHLQRLQQEALGPPPSPTFSQSIVNWFDVLPRFMAYTSLNSLSVGESALFCSRTRVFWLQGLYKGEEKNEMHLGVCSRSNDVIEPMIKPQWYVNCNGIAKKALDVLMDENNKKIDILPKQYAAEWKRWLENICDWCVSRQLWWGHRVPAWYVTLEDAKLKELGANMDHWVVARDEKEAEAEARKPDDTQDLKTFYPTAVHETGHDILFFWVAAMVMLEMILGGDVPFQKVAGGLASETPHMISAAVKGITPLSYEFTYLVSAAFSVFPSSFLLLRRKNKEIIKVKLLLEMLVKKCGIDAVKEVMPEEHMRLLTNIRKRMVTGSPLFLKDEVGKSLFLGSIQVLVVAFKKRKVSLCHDDCYKQSDEMDQGELIENRRLDNYYKNTLVFHVGN
ncbi:unnamed protein product [Lactuca saligna]|uniref:valine--tRNA ligase n=1 Tax=Lactuca saligna TaxID=75948 RepID=A0AA36ERX0_LACSI|nr:unnamed protein product [Lactuca saligna]